MTVAGKMTNTQIGTDTGETTDRSDVSVTEKMNASGAGVDVMTTGAGTEIVTLIEVRERGGVIVMTEIVTTLAEVAGIVTGIVTTGGAVVVTEAETKRKTSPSKLN